MIGVPPSLGLLQDKLICDVDAALAVSPVGVPGTFQVVMGLDDDEKSLVAMELAEATRKM